MIIILYRLIANMLFAELRLTFNSMVKMVLAWYRYSIGSYYVFHCT